MEMKIEFTGCVLPTCLLTYSLYTPFEWLFAAKRGINGQTDRYLDLFM